MLYHGTAGRNINSVLAKGIEPRGILGNQSTWNEHPSKEDKVYLTNAYAFFFAINAASDDDKAVVFEIDETKLDANNLFPDEDFLCDAFGINSNEAKERQEQHQKLWKDSVKHIGNCCYQGTIPSTAITRYCVFDFNQREDLEDVCRGAVIKSECYTHMKTKYINLTEWFFGEVDTFILNPALVPPDGNDVIEFEEGTTEAEKKEVLEKYLPLIKQQQQYQLKQQESMSKDRSGIEIVSLK